MGINSQEIMHLNKKDGTLRLTIDWTSNADGDVAVAVSAANMAEIQGKFLNQIITNPGATAPADDYDLTLVDAHALDILGGAGANRDTANSELAIPAEYLLVDTALTFTIANAGNAKDGVVVFYFGPHAAGTP